MIVTCNDPVFGTMTYRHRWYKEQKINLFGREWPIKVVAKAYSGKVITEEQQQSYIFFCDNEDKLSYKIANCLKQYINLNLQELATYWIGARTVNLVSDLAQMVEPKTLLFKQDGTILLLLNCVWDDDHGVAVKMYPEFEVGNQDSFL